MHARYKKILRYWPLLILLFLEIILFSTNYSPGTYLIGWDNVMPEFNFKVNFIRSVFGVWQEHRGVGLYDGMSHIANLLHTAFLWVLSLVLPQNLLRYTFTFSMHLLGGVGMYVLLKWFKKEEKHPELTSLAGALFYLFNIATIQMFFTPLESFSVHFATLPWLAFALLRYLKLGSKKSLIYFCLVSFLATAQFFVTTLFIPVIILLGIISIHFLLSQAYIQMAIKRIFVAGLGFLFINSFWLLPYLYGLPKNAPVIASAKINQQSTPEVFARNQAFGDLKNTLLLRGFMLDTVDRLQDNTVGYMMAVWKDYIDKPAVLISAFICVILAFSGIIITLHNNKQYLPFVFLFAITFFMLGNDLVLIREINRFLREHIPFFGEVFRFPFTKFSLVYAFAYSVLLAVGLEGCIQWLGNKYITVVVNTVILVIIFYTAIPVYQSNFISSAMRLELPKEYQSLFNFMKELDQDRRVAYLPQPTHWSWKHYRWGYTGSGFLWYGIEQPLLDRAFDPWSHENENYFWELAGALYTKESDRVEAVLRKYDVSYILLDETLASSTSYMGLYIDYIKEMLSRIANVSKIATFGKLTLYERKDNTMKLFVSLKQNLPLVLPAYKSTDNDIAYQELGDYLTQDKASKTAATYVYPYRSLFSKRSVNDREFMVIETPEEILITTTLDKKLHTSLPYLVQPVESLVNTQFEIADNKAIARVKKQGRLVFDSTVTQSLAAKAVTKCDLFRQGSIKAENVNAINDAWLRLESINQRACLSFGIPNAQHSKSYLLAVASRNKAGRPILFSIINQTAKHTEFETYLPEQEENKEDWQTTYFILPPLAHDGLGYTVYLTNDSIGRHASINEVGHIYLYEIPYDELTQLHWVVNNKKTSVSLNQCLYTIEHPNPMYYQVKVDNGVITDDTTIVLSQAFDKGWTAFIKTDQFPYMSRLDKHVLVNNWANGWLIENSQLTTYSSALSSLPKGNSQLKIIYLPQYLEYLGFGLLWGFVVYLVFSKRTSADIVE